MNPMHTIRVSRPVAMGGGAKGANCIKKKSLLAVLVRVRATN